MFQRLTLDLDSHFLSLSLIQTRSWAHLRSSRYQMQAFAFLSSDRLVVSIWLLFSTQTLHARYVLQLLYETKKLLKQMPNIIHLSTSYYKEITICGGWPRPRCLVNMRFKIVNVILKHFSLIAYCSGAQAKWRSCFLSDDSSKCCLNTLDCILMAASTERGVIYLHTDQPLDSSSTAFLLLPLHLIKLKNTWKKNEKHTLTRLRWSHLSSLFTGDFRPFL